MQVTDRFNLLPPGICIVCETQPDGDVIDTLVQHRTGVASHLNGRKYVCGRCVEQMANLMGFESGTAVKQSKIDADYAQKQLAMFRQRVVDLAEGFVEFAQHPGAADEGIAPKPEVEEVFPAEPVVRGGTTQGVQKVADSETPSVPFPAAASAGTDVPVEDKSDDGEASDEVESEDKPKPRSKKGS
jgi:hypothetical protein